MRRHILWMAWMVGIWGGLPGFVPAAAARPETWLKAADALLAEAEMIDGRNLRRAVQERAADLYRLAGHELPGKTGADALLKAGKLYVELGGEALLAKALECATLVSLVPEARSLVPDALMLNVEIYRQQREWGRAVRAAIACADDHPRHPCAPQALLEAGRIFENSIRNPTEAERQYTRIIERHAASPAAADALFARAGLRAKAQRNEEALADYLALVAAHPTHDLADQALFEAITLAETRLKDFSQAYELAVRLRTEYPHSALRRRAEQVESRTLRYVRDAQR